MAEDASAEELLHRQVNDDARREPYEGMWSAAPSGTSTTSVPIFDDVSDAVKQVAREKQAKTTAARSITNRAPGDRSRARPEQSARPASATLRAAVPVLETVERWWAELRARNPDGVLGAVRFRGIFGS